MNNDIPQPKFSVSEQVIIHAEDDPDHLTEPTILEVIWSEEFDWKFYEEDRPEEPCWMYEMIGDEGFIWEEKYLRKKHDGSEFTFDQLMSTLKQPCNV